jgi:hypothetical protein
MKETDFSDNGSQVKIVPHPLQGEKLGMAERPGESLSYSPENIRGLTTNISLLPWGEGGRRPDEGDDEDWTSTLNRPPHPNPLPPGERGQNFVVPSGLFSR